MPNVDAAPRPTRQNTKVPELGKKLGAVDEQLAEANANNKAEQKKKAS